MDVGTSSHLLLNLARLGHAMRQCFPEPAGISAPAQTHFFGFCIHSHKLPRSKFHWVILSQRCVPAGNVQLKPQQLTARSGWGWGWLLEAYITESARPIICGGIRAEAPFAHFRPTHLSWFAGPKCGGDASSCLSGKIVFFLKHQELD